MTIYELLCYVTDEAQAEALRDALVDRRRTIHFGCTMHTETAHCGMQGVMVAILPRLVTCKACIALMKPHDRKEVL
jgi:hypothetical protein